MSMLTPPGMGGKYKITGDAYPRMRRRRHARRRGAAGVAVLVGLGVLGWGTLQLVDVFQGSPSASAHERRTDCPAPRNAAPPPEPLPAPKAVTVNVYNATTRTGLARSAADELERRGFRIGKVGNASAALDKKVKESAVLIGGPKAGPALTLLGAHIAGERSDRDTRADGSVDLVLGNGYGGLATKQDASRTLAERGGTAGAAVPGGPGKGPGKDRKASGEAGKGAGEAGGKAAARNASGGAGKGRATADPSASAAAPGGC